MTATTVKFLELREDEGKHLEEKLFILKVGEFHVCFLWVKFRVKCTERFNKPLKIIDIMYYVIYGIDHRERG